MIVRKEANGEHLLVGQTSHRMKQVKFADHDSFIKAYFQAPT
jgi:hypothetical protein